MSKVKFPRAVFVVPSGETFFALKDAKEAASAENPDLKVKDAIRKYAPVLPKVVDKKAAKKPATKKAAKKVPAKKAGRKAAK